MVNRHPLPPIGIDDILVWVTSHFLRYREEGLGRGGSLRVIGLRLRHVRGTSTWFTEARFAGGAGEAGRTRPSGTVGVVDQGGQMGSMYKHIWQSHGVRVLYSSIINPSSYLPV